MGSQEQVDPQTQSPSTTKWMISVKSYSLKFPALSQTVNSARPHAPGADPGGRITAQVCVRPLVWACGEEPGIVPLGIHVDTLPVRFFPAIRRYTNRKAKCGFLL